MKSSSTLNGIEPSALARRRREVPSDQDALDLAKQALSDDWPNFLIMKVTQGLVEQAGDLADTFALRGYDSVQLASAHLMQQLGRQLVTFACFDRRLSNAARVLGLATLSD